LDAPRDRALGVQGRLEASARLRFNSRGAQTRALSASRATTMPASCIASVSSRSLMATVIDFAAGDKYGIKSHGSSTRGTRETLVSVANLIARGELIMPLGAIYPCASLGRIRRAWAAKGARQDRARARFRDSGTAFIRLRLSRRLVRTHRERSTCPKGRRRRRQGRGKG
jgi:hypothetical protein